MIGFLETVLSFVLVLGILVFVHEFGHFVAAKWFGIGVPVFSFGFGPRLFGFQRRETDYRVSAIPLGGYVRLAGDEADENRTGAPEEFLSRPRYQRFIVFLGGAFFNIVLAFLVAWLMFWIYGKDEVPISEEYPVIADVRAGSTAEAAGLLRGDLVISIAGRDARDPRTQVEEVILSPDTTKKIVVERDGARLGIDLDTGQEPTYHLGFPGWLLRQKTSEPPEIDLVVPGTPAEAAGLAVGDRVIGVDDRVPIEEIELRALLAASPGRELTLVIERNGARLHVPITPRDDGGRGRIGVDFRTAGLVHLDLGLGAAALESVRMNVEVTRNVFLTLRKLVRGDISVRAFSGPIEIARVSREAVKRFRSFLTFLALISLQLGILNLLPIPVLDGGHILILGAEAVIRRDLSDRLKERVMQAGLVVLLVFFGFVIYFDVVKTWFSS